MNRLLIPITLIIASCASTPDVEEYSIRELGKKFDFRFGTASNGEETRDVIDVKRRRPWSSNKSILRQVSRLSSDKAPDYVFKKYCSRGRQVRSLKTNITAIVSRPPQGVAIDKAQAIQKRKREIIRHFAKSYFMVGVFDDADSPDIGPVNRLAKNKLSFNIWEENKYTETTTYNDKANLFALGAKGPQEYIDFVKQAPVDCSPGPGHGWRGPSLNATNPKGMCNGLTLLSLGNSKELVLSLIGATHVNWVDPKSAFGNPYMEIDRSKRTGFIFAKASNDDVEVHMSPGKRKLRPLVHLYPLETTVFVNNYTMLIPEKIQREFFKERFEELKFYDKKTLDATYGFGLQRKGGKKNFSFADAISDRWQMWRDYLELATKIKEAQTIEPEVVKYEVSLNLGLFCKYGRRIESLISN